MAGFDSTAAAPDWRLICKTSIIQLHTDPDLDGHSSSDGAGNSPCHADWATLLCQYAQCPTSGLCSQGQMSICLGLVSDCS